MTHRLPISVVCMFSVLAVSTSPGTASEFAAEVVEYVEGAGVGWDYIDFEDFNQPANALGPPTTVTTGDDDGIPLSESVPVTPVYAPFRAFELVTIGDGGRLVLQFDHKVLDDPDNPYGLDFIVFGNAQLNTASGFWTNRKPAEAVVGSGMSTDPARVSVSQDGTNWFVYTDGPFADTFAPTMGRVFDPDNVDTNLGPWNLWWGAPTDPTFPLDPSVSSTNLMGWTVENVVRHYRHSAGGTGYDISGFPLSPDPVSGMKWIQFVKIEPAVQFLYPEVDALSDVAPLSPYPLWKTQNLDWFLDPAECEDDADPEGDGLANLLEFALHRDPAVPEDIPAFELMGLYMDTSPYFTIRFIRNAQAEDVVVSVESRMDAEASWSTNGVEQALLVEPQSDGTERITAGISLTNRMPFLRLTVSRP